MSTAETVTIEIDGQAIQARPGALLIEVADAHGFVIPRFCYHPKLSIAANCRMCLVDVEKSPKPLPACATPITAGMKIFTRSARAISAQKATMEFLLINHPLDCPICDQGGECELQDVAVGFGGDVSKYLEAKRVVKDKNIGPLISTEMTRCIHCTRCVRFGEEIAGLRELGATGRGEDMQIGTYIEQAMVSELSGNVIDICPVGALTAKPSRFGARAWELQQFESIAPHDCVGSNLYVHSFRRAVSRVVPRTNESVNECWISDRDRFSYKGLQGKERLSRPMIKLDGQWRETDWQSALDRVFALLQDTIRNYGAEQIGILVSPNSTVEEQFLLKKLANAIRCPNIDHRLRQMDFTHQGATPRFPRLGISIAELEVQKGVLLIGSNVRQEQPLIAHRLRKAVKQGAQVCQLNHRNFDLGMPVAVSCISHYRGLVLDLAAIIKAIDRAEMEKLPHAVTAALNEAQVTDDHRRIVEILKSTPALILLGNQAQSNPYYSLVELLARTLANLCQASFGYLTDGANAAGAWLSGCVPHRELGGLESKVTGLNAYNMLEQPRNFYLLHQVEPEYDCADPMLATAAMQNADCVVCLTPYLSQEMQSYADVLLPTAPYSETSGSYINIEGILQRFGAAGTGIHGEARPAWKIIRVLGNYFNIDDMDYSSSEEVLAEFMRDAGDYMQADLKQVGDAISLGEAASGIYRCSEVNPYRCDGIVRHSEPLQKTPIALDDKARMATSLARRLDLLHATHILVKQSGKTAGMSLMLDDNVPENTLYIPAATLLSKRLGALYGIVEIEAD